ncbi:MAG: efflux RND transporter periplasmic adaptor subunit, partial [Alphaproteobacteria bacterium]
MKFSKRHIPAILGAVAMVSIGGFVLARTLAPKPAPPLLTAPVQLGHVENAVLATGTLNPANVVNVGAEVSGRIVAMNVAQGDLLHQGDVIAQIDAAKLLNDLAQAQGDIVQAEATLRDRMSQMEFGRSQMERQKSLVDKGVAPRAQYEQGVAMFASYVAQMDNQRAQIDNQKLALDQRRLELAKATIRSPITGIVAEVISHKGDSLNVSRQTPVVVRMADITTMIVRAQVSEADIRKVSTGQKVYFTVLGQPGRRRYATVKSTEVAAAGVSLDPELTTGPAQAIYYNVTFETTNEDATLMPSMTAEVRLVLGEADNVMTVPSQALSHRQGSTASVQVVDQKGAITARQVSVGISNSFLAEIKSGLKVGERVLLPDPVNPGA